MTASNHLTTLGNGTHLKSLAQMGANTDSNRIDAVEMQFKTRLLLETHRYEEALKTADEAIRNSRATDELILEKVLCLYLHSGCDETFLKKLPFYDSSQENFVRLQLARELYERKHLREALGVLDEYLRRRPRCEEGTRLFEEWSRDYYPDSYYRYYGYVIMGLQVLTTAIVLFVGILLLGTALDSWPQLFSSLFTLLALGPVFWINLRMIGEKWKRSERCSTEVFEEFLKVRHYGDVFHLSRASQETHLYQDDNDYSYISWIRHLPFVPNYTYIRSRDLATDEFLTVPLHGVADGTRFGMGIYKSMPQPLNMLGVRLGQWESFFSENHGILRKAGEILFVLGLFLLYSIYLFPEVSKWLYSLVVFQSPGNHLTYLEPVREWVFLGSTNYYTIPEASIPLALFALTLPLLFPRQVSRFLGVGFSLRVICQIFKLPIVRPGILLLAFLCFYQHYSPYSTWYIPSLCLSFLFYFAFVRTRYKEEEKEVVSRVSSLFKDRNQEGWLLRLFHLRRVDIMGIDRSYCTPVQTLFLSERFIVAPLTYMGLTLRFLVANKRTGIPLKVQKSQARFLHLNSPRQETKIFIGRHSVRLSQPVGDVVAQLEGAHLPFELVAEEPKKVPWLKFIAISIIGGLIVSSITRNHWMIEISLGMAGFFCFLVPLLESLRRPWWLALGGFLFWQVQDISYLPGAAKISEKTVYSMQEFRRIEQVHGFSSDSMSVSFVRKKTDALILRIWGPPITYGDYEKYILTHRELSFSYVPPMVAYQHHREDSLSILSWHLYQKYRPLDGRRYRLTVKEFCEKQGLGVFRARSRQSRCGVNVSFPKRSSQAVEDLLAHAPRNWINRFPITLFSRAVREDPSLYSQLPEEIRQKPEVLNWTRFWLLLALREDPALISEISADPILGGAEFLKIFLRSYARNQSELKGFREILQVPGVMEVLSISGFFSELVRINPLFIRRFPLWKSEALQTTGIGSQGLSQKLLSHEELNRAREHFINLLSGRKERGWTQEDQRAYFQKHRKLISAHLRANPLEFTKFPKNLHMLVFSDLKEILSSHPRLFAFVDPSLKRLPELLFRAYPPSIAIRKVLQESDFCADALNELMATSIPLGLHGVRPLVNSLRSQGSRFFSRKPLRYRADDPRPRSEEIFLSDVQSRFGAQINELDLGKWFAMFLVKRDRCWVHRHGFQYRTDPDVIDLFYADPSIPCF